MRASILRGAPARLGEKLLETIYPRTCAVCDQRGEWLCDICAEDFTPLVPELCCDRCGHPILNGRCACREMHPAIIRARAFAAYDGWVTHAVRRLKYERERDRAPHLAERMLPFVADLGAFDAVISVPMHPERLQWRGFNQAELLARCIGRGLGVPVDDPIQRVKFTEAQTRSTREDRIANMDGAFALNPDWRPVADGRYLVIDDVYTTGATVGACAEVLSAAGVASVTVLTAAFDLQRRDLELYKRRLSGVLRK